MFDTLIGVIVLLTFALPGFIVTQLAESRRATNSSGGDLEIVLRSLWYSVALNLIAFATGWTSQIYNHVQHEGQWEKHVLAIGLFIGTVVFAVPVVLGMGLGRHLRAREQRGKLRSLDYALGGRDARQAWDYVFEHLDGGFVVVQLKTLPSSLRSPSASDRAATWNGSTILGKYGEESWATQTPGPRYDVFLEEVWPADAEGRIIGAFDPPRGLLIGADNVASLYCLEPSLPDAGPGWIRRQAASLRKATLSLSAID
jgi:hypothetical protein